MKTASHYPNGRAQMVFATAFILAVSLNPASTTLEILSQRRTFSKGNRDEVTKVSEPDILEDKTIADGKIDSAGLSPERNVEHTDLVSDTADENVKNMKIAKVAYTDRVLDVQNVEDPVISNLENTDTGSVGVKESGKDGELLNAEYADKVLNSVSKSMNDVELSTESSESVHSAEDQKLSLQDRRSDADDETGNHSAKKEEILGTSVSDNTEVLAASTVPRDTGAEVFKDLTAFADSTEGGAHTTEASEFPNDTQINPFSSTALATLLSGERGRAEWVRESSLDEGYRRGTSSQNNVVSSGQSVLYGDTLKTDQSTTDSYNTVKAREVILEGEAQSGTGLQNSEESRQPFVDQEGLGTAQIGTVSHHLVESRDRRSASGAQFTYSAKRRMARQEGDIIIGALFPVHHHPPIQTAYSRVCGQIRENYGIHRIETFQMTVDEINNDPTILPNITLGWDIRDSCWYSAIALEQSIDFIRDAIASKTVRDGQLVSALEGSDGAGSPSPSAPKTYDDRCSGGRIHKPIVGLIGPGSSEASIQVQNLMQIFNIPQIGYSATSMDLSDKNIFKYFLRVVPPDNYQVRALVDLVVSFNWTYISTVHSDGNYGIRGHEMFKDVVGNYNVCIASTDSVASSDSDEEFDRVVDTLRKTPNASVVVCFCEGITVKKLLTAIKRKAVAGKFLIIGSDGWGNRPDVVRGQEDTAAGGISIKLFSPPIPRFDEYYASLTPDSPTAMRNPWFKEFWQQKFGCYLEGEERDTKFNKPCTGQESLKGTKQDSKLGFVVNAVKTMALALHNMHKDLCAGPTGLCPAMTPINGTILLDYLLNVSFESYSKYDINFDSNGDPPGRYEILNYQPVGESENGETKYDYVTIGRWMTGVLELNESAIYWPGKDPTRAFRSVCSEECGMGFVKQGVGSDGSTCCWVCTPCRENEIVTDAAHCEPCGLGRWPNSNQTDCEPIDVEFVTWRDTGSIVVMVLACVGLFFTAWVAAIFIRSHDTPVVKASTRELSYILLIGISLAFLSNFLLVAKPAQVFCYLTRIIPGLAFSLMYGALVTRTNRIARILEGSKRIMTKKPRFMSATAQVVITGIIIGIECVIITAMLVIEPADCKLDYSIPRRVKLVCNTSTLGIIVPLGFDLFLIFMCTLYAVKTRNLPENFNEAKFIGFTMYTTCVIWLGFFPIYFGGENKEVTMCISISLSAAIALVLLFFPKVYIIVWAPEKNTRGAFTTSKDVRCHIGSKSVPSSDSMEFKEGRYDAVSRSDTKVQRAWRQKSLDEKKLRFVMKRSSMPTQITASANYVNHGVLPNHKAQGGAAVNRVDPKGNDSKKKSPSLKSKQRVYIDDFSDFDCLLEEESCDKDAATTVKFSLAKNGRLRDSECQTGDDLIQAMFMQLRRRRPNSSDSSTPSPQHPPPPTDFVPVKNVTFNTHVVPVHIDSSWHQQSHDHEAGADELPSQYRAGEGTGGARVDFPQRRMSDGSSLSYIDGVSCPDTPVQSLPRRCSDTSDISSSKNSFLAGMGVGEKAVPSFLPLSQHPHHSIYHRPPTPRTPRKLIIQNVNETAAGGMVDPVPQTRSRDSLPSPNLLHAHSTPQRVAQAPSSLSLTSTTSQNGKGNNRNHGKGKESQSEEELSSFEQEREAVADDLDEKGVLEFKQYLHDHGLMLDMSSVQTSDL